MAAISILRQWWRAHRRPLRTLVLCPTIVVYNWQREFAKCSPSAVSQLVTTITGSKKQREKQFAKAKAEGKQVFITNIETISTKFFTSCISPTYWEMLILDESHRLKAHNGVRAKRLIKLADGIPYKYILTGTPILNSELDLWAQFRILDKGIFPDNFFVFKQRYFYDANAGMPKDKHFPNWTPRPETRKILRNIVAENSHRVLKRDVLDLPPLVRQALDVPMTPQQKQHYVEMERDFLTYIDDETACVATLALTKILRLMQICCGILSGDDGEVHRVPCQKSLVLKDLLSELCPNHKVIVWSNFIETYRDIEEICNDIRLPYSIIVGGQKMLTRQEQIDAFTLDPKVRVMIANQAAGGTGVNLTAASYSIYYSKNFSLGDDLQSMARNHRGGSEIHDKITRIDLVTQDSIEADVTESLALKQQLANLLLNIKQKRKAWKKKQA